MDGRTASLCVTALIVGAGGCVPSAFKTTSIETRANAAAAAESATESSPMMFQGSSAKKEPRVELALAVWREKKASTLRDNPDQQFRELDEARQIYQEVLQYDPANIEALRGLGRTYVAMGNHERAIAAYRKALEKHPRSSVLHAEFSIAFSKRNQFDEAIKHLTNACALDPENQDHLRMLGVNLVCAGQIDRGVQALTRARGAAAAHYYVARILVRKNQPDAARHHLRQALDANANLTEARTLLAELDQGQTPGDMRRQGLEIQFTGHDE